MFRSATIMLTLWYVLLSMLLSIFFSVVLYHFSTHELAEALNNQYQVLTSNDHDGDNKSYASNRELEARSHSLLQYLIFFNSTVLIGASLASYALARRTLKPIQVAHEAQVRFTAEASHELRTPLTAMRADTEATLMQNGDDVALLRRTLKDNIKDIVKLENLTNHLLEISRYQSKAVAAYEDIDLEAATRDVMKQFKHRIKSGQLRTVLDLVPLHIKGDSQGVRQLIRIVIDNAVKYSQARGEIHVSLKKQDEVAVIIIRDNGIGIHSDDLPHIFDRFYRSRNAATSKEEITGYGLGLPLAKEIVELHKGSIEVKSKEHHGATVTLKLPLHST